MSNVETLSTADLEDISGGVMGRHDSSARAKPDTGPRLPTPRSNPEPSSGAKLAEAIITSSRNAHLSR